MQQLEMSRERGGACFIYEAIFGFHGAFRTVRGGRNRLTVGIFIPRVFSVRTSMRFSYGKIRARLGSLHSQGLKSLTLASRVRQLRSSATI